MTEKTDDIAPKPAKKRARKSAKKAVKKNIISDTSEWSFELIDKYDQEIARVAADFGLDTYPN
jgi:stage V sporulation protein R